MVKFGPSRRVAQESRTEETLELHLRDQPHREWDPTEYFVA
jgi:hypothetical protein